VGSVVRTKVPTRTQNYSNNNGQRFKLRLHTDGQLGMLYSDSGDGGNCSPPRLLSKTENYQREAKAYGD
jgi:hypothetical protein